MSRRTAFPGRRVEDTAKEGRATKETTQKRESVMDDREFYKLRQIGKLSRKAKINIPGVEIRKGVWVQEGTTVDPKAKLLAPVVIGKGCRIAAGARIGPGTVIGDRAQIGHGARLESCILFDNVTVGDNVRLTNCIIGPNGRVRENISVFEAAVLNIRA